MLQNLNLSDSHMAFTSLGCGRVSVLSPGVKWWWYILLALSFPFLLSWCAVGPIWLLQQAQHLHSGVPSDCGWFIFTVNVEYFF